MSKLNLQANPYQTYGFTEGSNSPMTSALAFTKNMNAKQSNLNSVGGKRSIRGGGIGYVTVPQFPQIGPNLSPINSNTSSIETNTTSIATKNNAVNDCYAFGNCDIIGGTRKHSKRKTKHRKTKHRKTKHGKRKTKHGKRKTKHGKRKTKHGKRKTKHSKTNKKY